MASGVEIVPMSCSSAQRDTNSVASTESSIFAQRRRLQLATARACATAWRSRAASIARSTSAVFAAGFSSAGRVRGRSARLPHRPRAKRRGGAADPHRRPPRRTRSYATPRRLGRARLLARTRRHNAAPRPPPRSAGPASAKGHTRRPEFRRPRRARGVGNRIPVANVKRRASNNRLAVARELAAKNQKSRSLVVLH